MASYSMIVTTLLLCGFLGHTNSQGKDANEVFNVWDINNLQITGANNPDVTGTQAFKDMNNILKQKCEKNGGAGAFERANRATPELTECIQNFVIMGQQSEEMARYAVTKDLHHVFKYYCHHTPVFKQCVNNFTAAVELCLDPQEKDNMKVIANIVDPLLSYVCFEDGDRIVQFISADGPECVQSKNQEILWCVMTTLAHYLLELHRNNGSLAESDSHPVSFGAKDCMDATTIQSCIVKELEECSDPTPANIVDSIFDVVLRATPCKEFLTDRSAASTSTINLLATSILFLVLQLI